MASSGARETEEAFQSLLTQFRLYDSIAGLHNVATDLLDYAVKMGAAHPEAANFKSGRTLHSLYLAHKPNSAEVARQSISTWRQLWGVNPPVASFERKLAYLDLAILHLRIRQAAEAKQQIELARLSTPPASPEEKLLTLGRLLSVYRLAMRVDPSVAMLVLPEANSLATALGTRACRYQIELKLIALTDAAKSASTLDFERSLQLLMETSERIIPAMIQSGSRYSRRNILGWYRLHVVDAAVATALQRGSPSQATIFALWRMTYLAQGSLIEKESIEMQAPAVVGLLDWLRAIRGGLSSFYLRHPETAHQQIEASIAEFDKFEDRIERAISLYADRVSGKGTPAARENPVTLRQSIQPGDVLLNIYKNRRVFRPEGATPEAVRDCHYAAFVVRARSLELRAASCEAVDLLIEELRRRLSVPSRFSAGDSTRSIEEYSAKILGWMLPVPETGRHFVVPDGDFLSIPIAVIVKSLPGRQNVRASIALTPQTLIARYQPPIDWDNGVVIGDPDFGSQVRFPNLKPADVHDITIPFSLQFNQTPGFKEELRRWQALLPQDRVFQGPRASKGTMTSVRHPSFLHIVTHGFLAERNNSAQVLDNPDIRKAVGGSIVRTREVGQTWYFEHEEDLGYRSGIALAGFNQRKQGDRNNGFLTAAEISTMDLRGTSVVTIAACESGLGEYSIGGSFAIPGAIFSAGARALVAPIWKVEDASANLFYEAFYRQLRSGMPLEDAHSYAQAEVRKRYPHPYYWAGYSALGVSK